MKHIGLFEGFGGFSYAGRLMGWETIAWCENNPFCQKILSYHFPKSNKHGDIKTTDFTIYRGKADILTGDFPCQPFSAAGKQQGENDDRYLWPEMLRSVREIRPRWIVAENVFGIVNISAGMVFDQICADLENEGYKVWPFLIPAAAINAPHKRDRVWFIAHANSTGQQQGYKKMEGTQPEQFNGVCFQQTDTNTNGNGLQGRRQQVANEKASGQIEQFNTLHEFKYWKNFPSEPAICCGNDGVPAGLDGITFSKWRTESIKGYGNAIVPQVAVQIFKAIEQYENIYQ